MFRFRLRPGGGLRRSRCFRRGRQQGDHCGISRENNTKSEDEPANHVNAPFGRLTSEKCKKTFSQLARDQSYAAWRAIFVAPRSLRRLSSKLLYFPRIKVNSEPQQAGLYS